MAGESRRDERGQVVPLAAVLLVVAGVVALGLVRVANAASDLAAAQNAADAAALAGAADGREAARTVAEANGATLTDYGEEGVVVTVEVRRGCCTARASATWEAVDLAARDGPVAGTEG